MRATKNSKRLPSSRPAKAVPRTAPGAGLGEYAWTLLLLSFIAILAAAFFHSRGYILYYGDAEAHLEIARRIFDSRTPGYDQIGTVWLPLPHLLMLPFIGNLYLWQTGLAGTIPGVLCFVAAGMFLFASARLLFGSLAPALATVLVFALNPNLLYLTSSPMTEPVFFASLSGLLYCTLRFARTPSIGAAAAAGVFSCAASMTRYEGWFLIPFVALYFLLRGGERRWAGALVFSLVAASGPLYWIAHNWILFGDPLEFYRGPYSAKVMNKPPYPGNQDWAKAWLYYRTAADLCVSTPVVFLGLLGMAAALVKRAWWALLLLSLCPAFYVLSIYSSGTPIFVPQLWPNSYYNTRYGLAVLPLFALGAGAAASLLPVRFRPAAAAAVVLIAALPWLAYPRPENWICWKESQVNSEARRAWTQEAASFLRSHYRKGDGVFFSFGDLTGVLREAGIPLREAIHTGNNPQFDAVIARPDLFLHSKWVIAFAGDPVATAVQKVGRTGPSYDVAKLVVVKGAPVIEIYRRPAPSLPRL